jgi:hypothetical protein
MAGIALLAGVAVGGMLDDASLSQSLREFLRFGN